MRIVYKVLDAKTRDLLFVGYVAKAEALFEYPIIKRIWYLRRHTSSEYCWRTVTYRFDAHVPTDREYIV